MKSYFYRKIVFYWIYSSISTSVVSNESIWDPLSILLKKEITEKITLYWNWKSYKKTFMGLNFIKFVICHYEANTQSHNQSQFLLHPDFVKRCLPFHCSASKVCFFRLHTSVPVAKTPLLFIRGLHFRLSGQETSANGYQNPTNQV